MLLADAAIPTVVSRGEVMPAGVRAGFSGDVIDLSAIREHRAEPPAVTHDTADLVYVIFTSGSTGKPKGVAMSHTPLVNLLRWQRHSTAVSRARAARVHPQLADRANHTLQFTPLTFDVSFLEIFATLQCGGSVVVPTEAERRDVNALLDLIERHRVASVFLPLVAMNQIAEAGVRRPRPPEALVEIMTGGEQLRITPQIAAWFARMPQCTLQNIYGPTEAHVVTTHELYGDPASWPVLPPIGRAIPNADLYLLDGERRPVAAGEVGELYIGGGCLARGYLGQPALTAERFVDQPLGPLGPARLYRTGDLAHVMADGAIMYDGRIDDQVKIQGVRIELGEIETVLGREPDVAVCAVVVRDDVTAGKRLIAYVVPRRDPPAQPVTLQVPPAYTAHLAAQLPDVMVPRTFVVMPALPTTSSGKVDRKALPAPATSRPALQATFVAPSTELERTIAGAWRSLLQVDEVGLDDGFFELGGGSLLMVKAQNQLSSALGRELPLVALFENPTVRSLARYVSAGDTPPSAPALADDASANERLARRANFRRRRTPES
jgi:amino acid adenylation domain-containing protein